MFCLRFFLVLSVSNPKPPWMMSSSANYKPFLSSFYQESFLFSGEFCLVSELNIQQKKNLWLVGEEWSKWGQNPSEMHIRTFARIKNVTCRTSCWLLRLKLSRVKLYFRFACMFTFEGNIQSAKEGITSGVSHGMH